MIAHPAQRMTEKVTVFHRPDPSKDFWEGRAVEGSWQERRQRMVSADGTVQNVDVLTVQIPEDQGDVEASKGDYLFRGSSSFSGATRALLSAHEGLKKVGTVRDLRGGLEGIRGPLTRYASALVLEAD